MLDSLRRGAVNWFAKGLLGLLVIAFAVWGIGDVIRNVGRGTLATIGGPQITVDEYRQAYQDEMASLTRRFGRRLTTEQAKLLGVEQRALARLISAAAIDHHARDLQAGPVRSGHGRDDSQRPRVPGSRRQVFQGAFPKLSAPDRPAARAAMSTRVAKRNCATS